MGVDVAQTGGVVMVFVVTVVSVRVYLLNPMNLTSMCFQLPELGLYSLAMMMAMLSNGIDLSVVSIGNLSAICAATIMKQAVDKGMTGGALVGFIILGMLAALAVGVFFGFFNGFVIANLNLAPMLSTMATQTFIKGISIIITQGKSVSGAPKEYVYFGSTTLLGIPYTMWLLIIVFILTGILLYRTRFGFEVKMVGATPKASHYTGINVNKVYLKKFFIKGTYLYSGIISSVCGLAILMRTNTAKADYAFTYVMQAILCSVLGATNPNGGTAKISCMILALLSLQFLSSGFNMMHFDSYFKEFTWGLLLIVVLSINFFTAYFRQKRGQHKA